MKLWNSPSDLNNNGQEVEEGQYWYTRIAFAECFGDIKYLIVFEIRYTCESSKLISFKQSFENASTTSEFGHILNAENVFTKSVLVNQST